MMCVICSLYVYSNTYCTLCHLFTARKGTERERDWHHADTLNSTWEHIEKADVRDLACNGFVRFRRAVSVLFHEAVFSSVTPMSNGPHVSV